MIKLLPANFHYAYWVAGSLNLLSISLFMEKWSHIVIINEPYEARNIKKRKSISTLLTFSHKITNEKCLFYNFKVWICFCYWKFKNKTLKL